MKPSSIMSALVLTPGLLIAGESADAALDRVFHQYLEAQCELSPMMATGLGDYRFNHLLDDVSVEARQRGTSLIKDTLTQLPKRVDEEKLTSGKKVDFAIFRDSLKRRVWLEETERPFERDPRAYTALATEAVYSLFAQSTQTREASISNGLARMSLIPRMLETGRRNLARPPRVTTETAIKQNLGAIGFYESEIFDLIGESERTAELKAAAQVVVGALREHQRFLTEELLPRSDGEWRLGKERFSRKLELVLGTGTSADETLAKAEAQLTQTRRDLLLIARQLWPRYFPQQAMPPDDEEGRRETLARVSGEISRDHPTPDTLASEARATVEKLKAFIEDRKLLRLPEPDRCNIIEMPEFQRGNAAAILSAAPTLDAQAQSIYAISPPPEDWDAQRAEAMLADNNRKMLQVLTIHEAYPGHYVQLAHATAHASLIRHVFGSGVLEEGWAVYCEQMMLDEGYGEGDLALRFMQLRFLLLAVGNAVLDHRMHCTSLTDEDAVRFVNQEMMQSEGAAQLKVIRAKQSSVQLSTYFAGRSALLQVRREVQRAMGASFGLGRYHEAVLEHGSVSVGYLTELVLASLQADRP